MVTVFLSFIPDSPKNVFKRKNGKKESREPVARMEDAERYKSRRAVERSGTVMRMQHTAGTILAALLTRFELKRFLPSYHEVNHNRTATGLNIGLGILP